MKQVDQVTGEDLEPVVAPVTGANATPFGRNPDGPAKPSGRGAAADAALSQAVWKWVAVVVLFYGE